MVHFADAVANPWTVVIHSEDTFLADFAVMDPNFFDPVAFETPGHPSKHFDFVTEFDNSLHFILVFLTLELLPHLSDSPSIFLDFLTVLIVTVLNGNICTISSCGWPGSVAVDL